MDTLPYSAMAVSLTLAFGSVGAILLLFYRSSSGRPLLAYEPRRSVPWNFLAATVTVVLLPALMTIAVVGTSELEAESPAPLTPTKLWVYAGASLLSTATLWAALVAFCRATPTDLGLPRSWRDLGRDLRIGVLAFLAILAPVYLLQWGLTEALQPDEIHPLIENLEANFTPALLWAAVVTAVLAAPLHEETVFRLILQGWLEKKEDQALRFDGAVPTPPDPAVEPVEPPEVSEEPPIPAAPPERPAMGILPGLPHGWAPVLASGALFSMAHLGHGVAPVSLLPLGVALGYVYQRTHRILPSVVCHVLFNGFSMTMLWLTLPGGNGTPGQ